MDYTSIFTLMRAEVTLTAILVLLFLYDLLAGERGRRHFTAVASLLLALQAVVTAIPASSGGLFGGMFHYEPMHAVVKSLLTVFICRSCVDQKGRSRSV